MARIRTLEDYYPLAANMLNLFVKEIEVKLDPSLSSRLARNEKLIGVFNHGPLLGPLAYCFAPLKVICEQGGASRSHLSIAHRIWYKVPVVKQVSRYITQLDEGLSFQELLDVFNTNDYQDFFVMPEGDNCNFGNGLDIQPFKSPRFVELALASNASILLVVQKGADRWGRPVHFSNRQLAYLNWLPKFLSRRLKKTCTLSVPRLPRKIERLHLSFRLYEPHLKKERLSSDQETRKQQLWTEANLVRNQMQEMVKAI